MTGPALKTVIFLQAIRPGDMVRITVKGTTLARDQEGEFVVQQAVGWSERYPFSRAPAEWAGGEPVIIEANNHLYTERSIVAWKPAKRTTNS